MASKVVKYLPGASVPEPLVEPDPKEVTIKEGDSIQWKNEDSAAHTITSGDPEKADTVGKIFDSGLILSKGKFETSFKAKGEYPYFCIVHPWKKGKIIVTE